MHLLAGEREPVGQAAALLAGAAEDPDDEAGDVGQVVRAGCGGWTGRRKRSYRSWGDPPRRPHGCGTMTPWTPPGSHCSVRFSTAPDGSIARRRSRARCDGRPHSPAGCCSSARRARSRGTSPRTSTTRRVTPACPELAPTLVRWAPPPGAPPHLAVGPRPARGERARREPARRRAGRSHRGTARTRRRRAPHRRDDLRSRRRRQRPRRPRARRSSSSRCRDSSCRVSRPVATDVRRRSSTTVDLDTPEMSFDTVEHLVSSCGRRNRCVSRAPAARGACGFA